MDSIWGLLAANSKQSFICLSLIEDPKIKIYKTSSTLPIHNIIIQHHVALVNELIQKGNLGSATSCRIRRLAVCYFVMYYIPFFITCFNLIRPSTGTLYELFEYFSGI
jgi:hypothetical protein